MLSKIEGLVGLLIALVALLIVSCMEQETNVAGDLIGPGDQISEMVLRRAVDESEMRPLLAELCGWVAPAELSEEKTVECVIAYEPTIFINAGMMEPDLDKRNEYWKNMSWEVYINGQPLDLEAFGTIDALGGRWWNVLLENPTSDPLQIMTLMTYHEDPIERLGLTFDLTVGSTDEPAPTYPALSVDAVAGQHAYTSETADLDFLLYVPEAYGQDPTREWPLILFLHGFIDGIQSIEALRRQELQDNLEQDANFPFIVASPMRTGGRGDFEYWFREEHTAPLFRLMEEVSSLYSVDPERVYLSGESAGGNGVWEIGIQYPDRFAALVPVMGYYGYPFEVPDNICDLKDVPIWAFHGALDEIVPLDAEQSLIDALNDCDGQAQITVIPNIGHDLTAEHIYSPELTDWLLSHSLE